MCKDRLNNRKSKEVHIYFEHHVNELKIVDTGNEAKIIEVEDEVNASNEKSYNDDYESVEDEAYKPPPGVEDEYEEEDVVVKPFRKKKKEVEVKEPRLEPQPERQIAAQPKPKKAEKTATVGKKKTSHKKRTSPKKKKPVKQNKKTFQKKKM